MASRTTDPLEILLELGVDLDNLSEEEDYLSVLIETINALIIKNPSDVRIPILQQEIIKIRKERKAKDLKFKARKTKINAKKFLGPGPSIAIEKYAKGGPLATIPKNNFKPKDTEEKKSINYLAEILKSVSNIVDILSKQYELKKSGAEIDRKNQEKQKRKLQETNLEKKFNNLKKIAEKIIAPVRSIIDRLIQFFLNILIGKFLVKLIDWIADPKNKSKIKSIIRFFSYSWPKLLSAYIIFGTGLGKFSRFLVKVLARGAVRLVAATTGLLARLFGASKLGRFSKFLGRRGKIISAGVEAVATIAAFKTLEGVFSEGISSSESSAIDRDIPTQGYRGGGLVQPIQKFEGGGEVQKFNLLNPFSWFSGKAQGAIKQADQGKGSYGGGIAGSLLEKRRKQAEAMKKLGYYGGGEVKGYEEGGEVDGPGGIDKVPAMLTDGEFVMSRGAVQKYGLAQLEAMNAAGGGTNKPKVMNGTYYARTGGPIGSGPTYREHPSDKNKSSLGSNILSRYFVGDKSEANKLALRVLGKKIDDNTKAVKNNTKAQRDNRDFVEKYITGEGSIGREVGQGLLGMGDAGLKFGAGLYDTGLKIASNAYDFAKNIDLNKIKKDLNERKDKIIDSTYEGLFGGLIKSEESRYVTPEKYASLSEKEKLDVLVKDPNKEGVTETALSLRNQKKIEKQAEFIRGIYDPEKDKGMMGYLKKQYQEVMRGGLLPDIGPLGQVATGFYDPIVSKLTGGKIKKVSSMASAVQMTLKGLLGPLGSSVRIDASPLVEYNKSLMDFAIKNKLMDSKGNYLVGKDSWSKMLGDDAYVMTKDPKTGKMVRGEHLYDKMQRESAGSGAAAKIANFGLGQFAFKVGKDGKAIINDTWDSNNTAAYYFNESQEALKRGDVYNALFKGFSGVLRVNQNTAFGLGNQGFANVTPAGIDIKSKSLFKNALNAPKPTASTAKILNKPKLTPYFSNTTGKFYTSYAEALKDPKVKAAAEIEKTKKRFSFAPQNPNVLTPEQPSANNIRVINVGGNPKPSYKGKGARRSGSSTPQVNPGNGDKKKWSVLGVSVPALW